METSWMIPDPHFVTDGKYHDFSPRLSVYAEHFGLREQPFHVTPDPRFFYPNLAYQEAYASLMYGIKQRKGFIVLTGEVGTGKTTLLRRLIANVGDSVHFAFVYNTTSAFDEVLDAICSDFELPIEGMRRLEKTQALNSFLLKRLAQGETVAVLIDEAHNLSVEALENLRLLSNLETGSEKLLQLVLVGQNELELTLTRPALRQLKDRVAIWCRLNQLKEPEVGPFIFHRLSTVGYDKQDLFTPDAIRRIALYSHGSPRQINIICDNALLLAYGTYQNRVSAQIIEEVAQDLRLKNGDVQVADTAVMPPPATAPEEQSEQRNGLTQRWSTRVTSKRITIVLAILLSVAGIWISQSPKEYRSQLNLTVNRLGSFFDGWLALVKQYQHTWFATETDSLEKQNEAISQTKVSTGEMFAAVAQSVSQLSENQKDEKRETRESASTLPPTLAPPPAVREQAGLTVGGKLPGQGWQPQSTPASQDREGQRIAVPHSATVLDLVSQVYGERNLLALDLVKESNPHVSDLDKVLEGEQLWLPALTRGTLLRQQPDASYHLILASFRKFEAAERLARSVQRKGYSAIVTPQRVSESILLHRVEITNLQEAATIEQAWELVDARISVSAAHPMAEALTTKIIGP